MTARSGRRRVSLGLLLGGCLTAYGCGSASTGTSGSTWLSRDPDEQQVQLERQLRGFDVAMMETGYRYVELYRAARDANWGAAAYHAGKIRLAIENALERRPKRAASAQPFLAGPLAAAEAAIAARDPKLFAERFESLTAGCNACHAMEKVSFFEVLPPEHRISPLRRDRTEGAED